MHQLIILAVVASFIGGCARKSEPPPVRVFEQVVGGMELPERSQLTVRDSEIIKVYHTGRRIDSSNPNIMYEAGQIYVVKRSPAWNTRPNVPVLSSEFRERLNVKDEAIDIAQKSVRQQAILLQESNRELAELSAQIRAGRERLEKLSQRAVNNQDASALERLRQEQDRMIQKLAELEAKNKR